MTTEREGIGKVRALHGAPAARGSAQRLEDLRGVAEGLRVGDLAVAQLVDPDRAILDRRAPLGTSLDDREDDDVVVVGAENLFRRGVELIEILGQLRDEVPEAIRSRVGSAPGERLGHPGLGRWGDRVEHPIDVTAPERVPRALDHVHVVLRHAATSSSFYLSTPAPYARTRRRSTTALLECGPRRSSSVGQSTALVKRGSRVRIPSPALVACPIPLPRP